MPTAIGRGILICLWTFKFLGLASLSWIDFQTGTNVLDVMVRRLRAKVDDPFRKKLIQTVRGTGYVLKAG